MDRVDKENYYLDIAQSVLERSTCLRRKYGAIIVRNDEIVSTGYNGAPLGGTLSLAGRDAKTGELIPEATCCSLCRRMVINAGISRVVARDTESDYTVVDVEDWVREDDTIPMGGESK